VAKRYPNLRFLVIGCVLLQWSAGSHATTCIMPSKRAPVAAACGRVTNIAGEQLDGVELSLTSETDSETFTAKSDAAGRFSFGPVPKGDYTLRATAPYYRSAMRQIRVTRSSNQPCTGKITVTLGFDQCGTGVMVKGADK
jgi:hypothetical protein